MLRQWRVLRRAASASSFHVALEEQLFATVSGAVCEKLCVVISTTCEAAFGLCSLPGAAPLAQPITRWNMNCCVWQGALLSCSNGSPRSFSYPPLSVYALAVTPTAMRP